MRSCAHPSFSMCPWTLEGGFDMVCWHLDGQMRLCVCLTTQHLGSEDDAEDVEMNVFFRC